MKNDITMETLLVRNESIPSTVIDGEVGLMNINTGKYYSLNSVGSGIWNNLNRPTSFHDLIALLTSEYEIDTNICISQVKSFIERSVKEGIILVK